MSDETLAPDDEFESQNETMTTLGATASSSSEPASDEPISRGTLVGRYVILDRLGAGAMGVVYAAYDPELDRKLALKLLKTRGNDRSSAQTRLRREAQALAKLDHRNVVIVHDVGVHGSRVFVAMEYVAGRTLGEWLSAAEQPRPWQESLRVLMDAGWGLAAAHEAGLVHRDFKPDNVMIGDDGRVRVMDFGLACADGDEDTRARTVDSAPEWSSDKQVLASELTATGTLLGTPAYMAPEQFHGGVADARTDQFAFCVSLHEALYGERPFVGNTVAELVLAVTQGQARQPSKRVQVPSWLRAVLMRGLSPLAVDRWPSMRALLQAIERGQVKRRRRVGTAASLLAGALLLGGGVAVQERRESAREAECRAAGDAIADIWNADTRAAVSAGMLASELEYAAIVVDKLMPWLDRRAEAWREHATLACRNATIDARWDAATRDKAQWCLDDHARELELIVDALAHADAGMVEAAVTIVAGGSLVASCSNDAALAMMPEPPALELRASVVELRRELLRVTILERAGKYDDALALARTTLERADALGWAPLQAALHAREASLLREVGDYAGSERIGTAAYLEAASSNTWDVAAMSATKLGAVVGMHLERPDEGKRWIEVHAVVAIAHAGDPFGLLEGTRLSNLAILHWTTGEYDEGAIRYQQALAIRTKVLGPEHPDVAALLLNFGALERARGRFAAAQALYQRALAIYEGTFGGEHPIVGLCLANLGNVESDMGDHAGAQRSYTRALAIQRRTLGSEHQQTSTTMFNLANSLSATHDNVQAEALIREALANFERTQPPESPKFASIRVSLASLLIETARFDEAEQQLELVRESLASTGALEQRSAGYMYDSYAKLHERRGELERAREMQERALSVRERVLGPEHPEVADSLLDLGKLLAQLGEHTRARELVERARGNFSAAADADGVAAADAWLREHP